MAAVFDLSIDLLACVLYLNVLAVYVLLHIFRLGSFDLLLLPFFFAAIWAKKDENTLDVNDADEIVSSIS
jgi:hypothetical protein